MLMSADSASPVVDLSVYFPPLCRGVLRSQAEDFQVEEIPAYAPAQKGDHLFLFIEKTKKTTEEAARELARALCIPLRDVGWAGQKDRMALTRQWLSLAGADRDAALALQVPGIDVLQVAYHSHKLRIGHLHGNRFVLRIRHLAPVEGIPSAELRGAELSRRLLQDSFEERIARLSAQGVPNAYGEQRFASATLTRALAWLRGEHPGPRDRRRRQWWFSVVQAALFNDALRRRLDDESWLRPLPGDWLRKEDTGGLFQCADPGLDGERVARGEVSLTGPIFGAKMLQCEGEAATLERAVLHDWQLSQAMLAAHKHAGPGSRRPLRVLPRDVRFALEGGTLTLAFALPKGAYATTLVDCLCTTVAGADNGPG